MDEQNIPIDINASKLLDWLTSRRHINKDWQSEILKIREKINNAIQDMPEHRGVVQLLSGQHINYFHCLKIIDILKETEADTKNLFGRYGSQRMKDWKDIVQMYERNSLYLAEAAQMLIRNSIFEVPSLRKQVTKLEQIQLECEKKIKELAKTETLTLGEFTTSCKQLGISGKSIKKELTSLLNDLPEIYESAAKKTQSLALTLTLHTAYLQYHSNGDVHTYILPLLSYIIEKGNTTTYEYTYGEKPISLEITKVKLEVDEEPKVVDTIDFGDDIDFDISPEKSEIDWGTLSTDDGFEIVEHTDLDINVQDAGIVVENSGVDGGIARGNEALTLLDNPKTRDQFLNDLTELEAFLLLRLYEKSNDSDVLDISQMQDVPSEFQMQSVESLTSMLGNVRSILNDMTCKRTQHLHNIKHFPKYIDMLAESLSQKLSTVDRIRDAKNVLEDKIGSARKQIEQILPVIDTVIKNTKILQGQVAEDISKKYKGRTVNIIGSVNML